MKLSSFIASLLLAVVSVGAMAATDRSYYVTELAPQQKFDVYNDGRNTFLQSIPGLTVTGATADGEFFIVKGVPSTIKGFMNGKPITVLRGTPPIMQTARLDSSEVHAKIQQLDARLTAIQAKAIVGERPMSITPVPPGAGGAPVRVAGNGPQIPGQGGQGAAIPAPPTNIGLDDQVAWRVTPADQNLRVLIERWSKSIGWTSIWDVERDIPISMSDEKVNNFKTAVRRVLLSTEFGDIQVKPCFYSNAVLRVVRKTTKCKPNE